MKKLLERQISSLPKINLPLVDVRDVAAAHVRAMMLPEAAGTHDPHCSFAFLDRFWFPCLVCIIVHVWYECGR